MKITRRKIIKYFLIILLWLELIILKKWWDFPVDISLPPPEVATPDHSARSPSGKYILMVSLKYTEFYFKILDVKTQNRVCCKLIDTDTYLRRFHHVFVWDENDRVWVYSGDIGVSFWELNKYTNQWEKYFYSPSGFSPPKYLRENRPRYFEYPNNIATIEKPAISPSKKYLLKVISSWEKKAQWFHFQIFSIEGKVLYSCPDKFYARRLNYFHWIANDTVVVYFSNYREGWVHESEPKPQAFENPVGFWWMKTKNNLWKKEELPRSYDIPRSY